MLDLIFTIKFVHVLAVALSFGTWLCLAIFMVLAHRSGNTSVVALTSQFVVKVELMVVAAALVLQPLSGFPLAFAIGLSPLREFWIVISSRALCRDLGLLDRGGLDRNADPRPHPRRGAGEPAAAPRLSAFVPSLVRARRPDHDRHARGVCLHDLAAAARRSSVRGMTSFVLRRERCQRRAGQHVGQALRQRLKTGAQIELLRRIVGAHGEFDDRAAELAGVSGDPRHQRARHAMRAMRRFDKKILQENHRAVPAGDVAPAAGRHPDDIAGSAVPPRSRRQKP